MLLVQFHPLQNLPQLLVQVRTVQYCNAEVTEYNWCSNSIIAAHDKEIQVEKKPLLDGLVHVAANGAVLLVLGYREKLILANKMTAGDLTRFLMYSLLVAGNLSCSAASMLR